MKVSIIIPTLARKTVYPLVENLLKQKVNFEYEIILIPQYPLKENLLQDKKIKIHYELPNKGFGYYRNLGIKLSRGSIIVFIDDDELPMDYNWLSTITNLIINGKENVVTAGVKIKLGLGYFTDSISLLGFPGGGALGYETIWPLKEKYYTYHFCGGNSAITKSTLSKVYNFSEKKISSIYGSEDKDLGDELLKKGIKIRYLKEATVYHEARKGLISFIRWNFRRGKAASDYSIKEFLIRFSTTKKVLKKIKKDYPYYFLGSLLIAMIKHVTQTIGFFVWKINTSIHNIFSC